MAREKGTGNLQKEKSGRWTIRLCISGKRISRSTGTKDRNQAERMLERLLAPLGLGAKKLPLAGVWDAYVRSPRRRDIANSTLNAKRLIWMHFARWMEDVHLEIGSLAEVTAESVEEYLSELRTKVCATTYNNYVCALREVFAVLSERAGIVDNPWQNIHLREGVSYSRRELTIKEISSLISSADNQEKVDGFEWSLLFRIGLYTGLRLGDCCQLKWSNVDLTRKIIQLIPSKTKRHSHGIPITIPIHAELLRSLEKSTSNVENDYVMPNVSEKYQSCRWKISKQIEKIFKSANIKMRTAVDGRNRLVTEASFHSLRHTFVSLAANAGVPLVLVQSIVGHCSTTMTRHYYHANESSLRRAISTLPVIKAG